MHCVYNGKHHAGGGRVRDEHGEGGRDCHRHDKETLLTAGYPIGEERGDADVETGSLHRNGQDQATEEDEVDGLEVLDRDGRLELAVGMLLLLLLLLLCKHIPA